MLINGKEINNLILNGETFTKSNHIGKIGAAYGDAKATDNQTGKIVSYFWCLHVMGTEFNPTSTWDFTTAIKNGTKFQVIGQTDNDYILVRLLESSVINFNSGNVFSGTQGDLYWISKNGLNSVSNKIVFD